MADETTKGPGATSDPIPATPPTAEPAPPDASQGGAEATILEEVIIKKEKPAPPAPPPAAAPAPPAPAIPIRETPPTILSPAKKPPISEPANNAPKNIGTDIAKILQDVKLPERRLPAQAGDAKGAEADPTPPQAPPVAAGSQAMPLQESVASPQDIPPLVTPRQAEEKADSIAAVHTLKDDLRGVVRDTKMSVVRAVSLEEDRRTRQAQGPAETAGTTQRSKRTFGVMFSIALLLVLGIAALFGVYSVMQQHGTTPPIPTASSILFAEQSVLLSVDNQPSGDLKRTISAARNASNATLGSITRVLPIISIPNQDGVLAQRPATFGEFMGALGIHAPDDLIRALGDDFFFGIHTVDKNAPLFVIPVTSYDHAFAGMLAWEATMNSDLAPAFTPVPALTTDQNGIPSARMFQDLVMRNYDVRALKDDSGNIELYYSFPTQNILIIAESPYSFPEILNRLQASRKL